MLEVRRISKSYGKNLVLDQVSMSVSPGECVGVAGSNGAGKSTLLEILAGGISQTEGEIFLDGEPVQGSLLAQRIGYVPQENPLFEELTVKDNLELWYRGRKDAIAKDMEEGVLALFAIRDFYRKKVSRLSGGMKKRLSIACALADKPDILILDEPGAALDLAAKSAIIEYLTGFAKEGGSVVLASHEMPELAMCHRLYGMKNGHLEELEGEINSKYLQRWMFD